MVDVIVINRIHERKFETLLVVAIRESPSQFENRIKRRVYVRRITQSTMYEKGSIRVRTLSFKHVSSAVEKFICIITRNV